MRPLALIERSPFLLVTVLCVAVAVGQSPARVAETPFEKVSREVKQRPDIEGRALWMLLLTDARNPASRVWMLLDHGRPGGDRLWLDRDGDGVLGEPGEGLTDSRLADEKTSTFRAEKLELGGREHRDFALSRRDEDGSLRLELKLGGKVQAWAGSGLGPGEELRFGDSARTAPVLVLDERAGVHLLPLFTRAPHFRTRPSFFAVKVGRRGSDEAAFVWLDVEALPGFAGVGGEVLARNGSGEVEVGQLRYDGFNCQGYASLSLLPAAEAPKGPIRLRLRCPGARFPHETVTVERTLR